MWAREHASGVIKERAALAVPWGGGRTVAGVRGGDVGRLWRYEPKASPAGGPARPGQATPPRPRVPGPGDGVAAWCRRPRHGVGSQAGRVGWRVAC